MTAAPSRRTALAALLATAATGVRAAARDAPVHDVTDTYHGVTLHDPYRYFENSTDTEARAWMLAQGAQARAALDRIEGRAAMEKRIAQLSQANGDAIGQVVRVADGRLFYLKRPRKARQFRLMVKVGNGPERVLVDPESVAGPGPHAINYFTPSWDGEHVAYGLSSGGSEDASLHVLHVASRKAVGTPIARVRESHVMWLPDSRSFTYNQLRALSPEDPETETYLDSSVMWLRLGQPERNARAIFGPTVNRQLGLVRLDVGSVLCAPGSPWMIARTTDTTLPEGSLFLARSSDLERGGEVPWKQFAAFSDKIVQIELQGDALVYRTHQGAPRYRVMQLDLRQPQLARAQEIAVPPEDGVIEGFTLGRDALMAMVRQGTSIGLRRYARGDRTGRDVPLPFPGAAQLQEDPAHAFADWIYTLSGWAQPRRVLRLRGDRSGDLGLLTRVQARPMDIEVEDVTVASHDGVQVPMTLLYRKGLPRSGDNPTLLTAYGAYGFSETAGFRPATLAWLESGGVLAYANVRGSGVYGEPWRMAGFKSTKPNTWKDGIACARWLVAQQWCSPRTLGVMGTSAGGIFVGRCITAAPELFAAAIFNVGVMDAVRAEDSANGITNISEFGSYRNPVEFPALLEMSTYHQIVDGTAYPAVLLVHGLNDPRVDVWHSAKAAARLQAASRSGKPILLRLDAQAGHGMGSTARQQEAQMADIYSFLRWQMGKDRQV